MAFSRPEGFFAACWGSLPKKKASRASAPGMLFSLEGLRQAVSRTVGPVI
jgi:hypothetical protein